MASSRASSSATHHLAHSAMAPCSFFAKGFCARGTTCYFEHPGETPASMQNPRLRADVPSFNPSTSKPSTSTGDGPAFETPQRAAVSKWPPKPPDICRFFLRGECMRGDSCRFQHSSWSPTLPYDALPEIPHSASSAPTSLVLRPTTRPKPEAGARPLADEPDPADLQPTMLSELTVSRKFGAAIVTLGPGAAIQQVQLFSEFSALQISGLPASTRAPEVQALLAGHGFAVEQDTIRVKLVGDHMVVATVTVQDPSFATNAVQELQRELDLEESPELSVCTKAISDESGAASNRFEMKSVSCSWFKPSRVAWLHYRSERLASKAIRRIGKRTIQGRKLVCQMQNLRAFDVRNPGSVISIQLSNLDVNTKEEDLARDLKGYEPKKIILGKCSYDLTDEQASALVRSLLESIGPLESWEMNVSISPTRNKGLAKFLDVEHAKRATRELSGREVPRFSNSKIFVNHNISVKFVVLLEMYAAIRAEVDDLRQSLASKSVHLTNYQPSKPDQKQITVRIHGEDAKLVAQTKSAFETILTGHVLKDGAHLLWDTFFASQQGLLYLKDLHQRHGVFIYRDTRRSHLALYGAAEKVSAVRQDILNKLAELAQEVHIISLTPDQQVQALGGGFRRIVNKLGKEKATLDIRQRPMRIIIRGSSDDVESATLLLNDQGMAVPRQIGDLSTPDCAVCWTTPDEPYATPCGHIYCTDCFARQCTSAAESDFPITCLGESGTCKQALPLAALEQVLNKDEFEKLLQTSFKLHVAANPTLYQYCLTPDCPEIYRATSTGTVHSCRACLAQICSTCHVLEHSGLSCAQNKSLRGEGNAAFRRWKRENGVRDCPKCAMPIQKSDGCNHMQCSACKRHFCWFCMADFDTGNETYNHMRAKHGDFGAR